MQVELKPCPFCGGDNASQFFHADTGYGESWHVECLSEDCGAGTGFYDTEAEAIATWNHRHQARAEVVREIVAWLRMNAMSGHTLAAQIEAKFGSDDAGRSA